MGTLTTMVPSVLFLLPLLANASPNCPEGWTEALSLHMGCLYLVKEGLDWWSAGRKCQDLVDGAHLVQINNIEQLAFLEQGLNFADGSTWTWHNNWWTAANDLDLEGDWTWSRSNHSNSGSSVGDFLWASDQPDNCVPGNFNPECVADENCGALVSGEDHMYNKYKMVDMYCDMELDYNRLMYSVCQFNPFKD